MDIPRFISGNTCIIPIFSIAQLTSEKGTNLTRVKKRNNLRVKSSA